MHWLIGLCVSSNPTHGEVYSIQFLCMKFASDLRWFSPNTPVSSTNKADRHDVSEILLKMESKTPRRLTPLI